MTIVGIDPGLDGGIGWIGTEGTGCAVMPTLAGRPDLSGLHDILAAHRPCTVFIEMPVGMPGQSSSSTFDTGRNYGMLVGALHAWGIPFEEVRPHTWKARMGLKAVKDETTKERKERAIRKALEMFPTAELKRTERCATYHDGMAEALLIAEYGRREFSGSRLQPLGGE